MNLANVMDELATALRTIAGLRVFPYDADAVQANAAIVGWPETITYDQTMGRGSDKVVIPMWVLVARLDQRSGRNALAAYMDGAGTKSIKAAVDGGTYTACDSVRVATVSPVAITSGGVEYLAAAFDIEITGQGTH